MRIPTVINNGKENGMIKLMHRFKTAFHKHPEEEEVLEAIEDIMDEREERGDETLVNPDELMLLKNLFKLRDMRASQVMIPRVDISGISVHAKIEDLKRIVLRDKFTRIPVYEKSLDNIIGILHTKDLLCALFEGKELSIEEIMNTKIYFVPPAIRALDLLREMQARRAQMAVVVDEFGCTDGLITLEDLLEEIVGEIEDEHDAADHEPLRMHRLNDDAVEVDARMYVDDLEEAIGEFLTPADKDEEIETVGGLVFHLAGRLPHRGEVIKHPSGLKFLIMDADARHIKKVKISNIKKLHAVPESNVSKRKIK